METCFADTPGIKGQPFSKKVGENRLDRDGEGRVTLWIGWFSPGQIQTRKLQCIKLIQEIASKSYFHRFFRGDKGECL